MTTPPTKSDSRGDLPQLETAAEAEERNRARVDALVDREPETAIALEASTSAMPCGLTISALSSRRFRRPFMLKLYILHKAHPGPRVRDHLS